MISVVVELCDSELNDIFSQLDHTKLVELFFDYEETFDYDLSLSVCKTLLNKLYDESDCESLSDFILDEVCLANDLIYLEYLSGKRIAGE